LGPARAVQFGGGFTIPFSHEANHRFFASRGARLEQEHDKIQRIERKTIEINILNAFVFVQWIFT
jgi:hypothetical protein